MTTTPPGVRALLAVFEAHLAEVRFPGVDLAGLTTAFSAAEAAHERVRAAEAELLQATADRATQEADLLALATRAHGYARVYCEATPQVAAQLAAISLPRPSLKDGAPRRRGRPRKVLEGSAEIIADAAE